MNELPNNETYARILEVASTLFSQRGYASVRLRDIAQAVGMRHASLYYYAPGGKEQLFIAVMECTFQHHRVGLLHAVQEAGEDIREQMRAIARWFISQAALDLTRMQKSDLTAIEPEQAQRLMELAFNSLREPIVQALQHAQEKHEIEVPDVDLAAMAAVGLFHSVHTMPESFPDTVRFEVGEQMADLLLRGLLKR